MKILFHHRIASRDGQAVHIEELIAALTAQGHEVVLVGPGGFQNTSFGGGSRFVAALKRLLPAAVYELLELAYSARAFLRLNGAIRRHRPDAIYERYSLYLRAGLWASRLHGLPLLLEVNGPLYEERAAHDGLALHRLARWAQTSLWRGADFVLPVTDVLAGYVRRAGVPEQRIAVVPNGIAPERFPGAPDVAAAKRALGLDGRLVLGFTGFVRTWHALDRIIDMIAANGERLNLHLLVVGDGPARRELEEQAARLGIAGRVTFTGVVERDAIAGHVSAFDIALQPGVTEYASPLKLFEYMALGRAVVAPDMANIREILTDGHDALLFPPDRPGGLAEAVLRLCEDDALRASVGARAAETIRDKRLTWDNNARRVVTLAAAAVRRRPEAEPALKAS